MRIAPPSSGKALNGDDIPEAMSAVRRDVENKNLDNPEDMNFLPDGRDNPEELFTEPGQRLLEVLVKRRTEPIAYSQISVRLQACQICLPVCLG